MRTLLLYGTLGCHLCELAEAQLQQLNPELFTVEHVDISESDQLVEEYGIRIPVLKDQQSSAELGWPFEFEQLLDFLEGLDWD